MTTEQIIAVNLAALGFDNPGVSALFQKVAQTVGANIDNTITEMSNSEASILNIINTQRYGKAGYYVQYAKAFQYGDNLTIDPVTLDQVYAVIDPTKQIVTQAAFEEIIAGQNSELFLKIATLDPVSGLLQPLNNVQLAAFQSYYLNFELPGLPVTIVNNVANVLAFNALATYYATYDLGTLQTNIANALTAFQTTFNFNGRFYIGDLQDYIKENVPGIRDFFMTGTTLDGMPVNGSQSLSSGYFNYITNIANNLTYNAVNA